MACLSERTRGAKEVRRPKFQEPRARLTACGTVLALIGLIVYPVWELSLGHGFWSCTSTCLFVITAQRAAGENSVGVSTNSSRCEAERMRDGSENVTILRTEVRSCSRP